MLDQIILRKTKNTFKTNCSHTTTIHALYQKSSHTFKITAMILPLKRVAAYLWEEDFAKASKTFPTNNSSSLGYSDNTHCWLVLNVLYNHLNRCVETVKSKERSNFSLSSRTVKVPTYVLLSQWRAEGGGGATGWRSRASSEWNYKNFISLKCCN